MRYKYLDQFLKLYYDTFINTIINLGVAFEPPTFEELFSNFIHVSARVKNTSISFLRPSERFHLFAFDCY